MRVLCDQHVDHRNPSRSRVARLLFERYLEREVPLFPSGDVQYCEPERLSVLRDPLEHAVPQIDKEPFVVLSGEFEVIRSRTLRLASRTSATN